ncbi:hypothetical protein B0H14DRAFT_2825851 [Mycena olivaceomarginata]|nr:hypothetical protein B0H14DRAFT_2825851 [Mycena olivaceomarginata]
MFSHASGIRINGGTFYNVSGDMNVQNIAPVHGLEASMTLGFGSTQNEGHQLGGVDRNHGHRGEVRMLPYARNNSHRVSLMSHSSQTAAGDTRLLDIRVSHPAGEVSGSTFDPLELRDEPPESSPGKHMSASGADTMSIDHNRGDKSAHPSTLSSLRPKSGPSEYDMYAGFPTFPPPVDVVPSSSRDLWAGDHNSSPDFAPGSIHPRLTESHTIPNDLAWNRPHHEPKTNIHGGTFISGSLNNIQRYGESGLHILCRAIAGDAFHDSAERYPQPQCHPETRTRMLDVLNRWVGGTEPPKNWASEDNRDSLLSSCEISDSGPSSGILWLHGPAGSGKSAIAQSFCQKLRADGRLGGSFFFKRGHLSRGNASKLFPTLAYQLALSFPEFNHPISHTIDTDPAIVNRSLRDQLQTLIMEPCRRSGLTHPMVLVIDGLDECEGYKIQQEILRSIVNLIHRPLPILFFISSRPEPHIRESFEEALLSGLHCSLDVQQSFRDVRKYLLDEFRRIHREHRTMIALPQPWPPSEIVETLVKNSSGYFIYASTVVKYIDDKNFRPVDRLEIIMGIKMCGRGSPFDILDQLYTQILSDVPLDSRPQLLQILTVLAEKLLDDPSVSEIEQLLELKPGDAHLIYVAYIPSYPDPVLAAHHASFLDFLNDSTRSGPFYTGDSERRTDLVRCMLKALAFTSDGGVAW